MHALPLPPPPDTQLGLLLEKATDSDILDSHDVLTTLESQQLARHRQVSLSHCPLRQDKKAPRGSNEQEPQQVHTRIPGA